MTERHEMRWGGVAGLGFVVLALIGQFLPGRWPAVDSASGEITAFVTDNRSTLLTSALLFGAAAALVVWFAAAFAEAIHERAERSVLYLAIIAGAVLVGGAMFFNATLLAGTAYGVETRSAELTVTLFGISAVTNSMIGFMAALPLVAGGIGVLRTHVMPDWIGYLAMLAAVLSIAGAFGVFFSDGAMVPGGVTMAMVPLLASSLFVLCAGLFLVREHLPEVVTPKVMPQI